MLHGLIQPIRRKIRQVVLLDRKPEAGTVSLTQRRVFTFPNRAGASFLVVLLILYIASINYSLSLGFALTYLLSSVAVINAFLGFRNLAYLQLQAHAGRPVFAGEDAEFIVTLSNTKNFNRYAIRLCWQEDQSHSKTIDVIAQGNQQVTMAHPTRQRGWQAISRIALESHFPLGILRAWSYWYPDCQTLVYPRPEENPPPLPSSGSASQAVPGHSGDEDFSGVKAYQAGDPLKHLAWKQIARIDLDAGGHLYTKQFSGGSGSDLVLDWAKLPKQMDSELRLSRLCAWILEAERNGLDYRLRLGQQEFPASRGEQHSQQCLRALALFEE